MDHFLDYLKTHKGKMIGIGIGFIFGVMVLLLGFFRTLFLFICILIGYYIGSKVDKRENFLEFLDKILPTGLK